VRAGTIFVGPPIEEETMHPYLLQQLAADHINDMHAEAAAQRLARQARKARRARRAARAQRDRAGLRTRSRLAGQDARAAAGRTQEPAGRAAVSGQGGSARGRAA